MKILSILKQYNHFEVLTMKKSIKILVISFSIASLSACSIAPGVPGLKTSSSRYAKPQKEGVDYKLIIINADTVRNQKPFDYAAYVREKKRRVSVYDSKSVASYKNKKGVKNQARKSNSQQTATIVARNKNPQQTISSAAIDNMARFQGVTPSDNKANYQYYIGKGDVLNITVWDHPELTTPSENNAFGGHVIGSDGRFYFPYSGKINAVGKTVRNIRDELESKLGSFITKPQVSVSIANYRSQKIYTSGALAKPSTLMIDDTPTTVRDAISKSAGVRPNQYTGFATLARGGNNISIDLNRMLKYNDNRQNFILKDGDRLNIVERTELDEFNRNLNLEVRKTNVLSSVRLRNQIKSLETINPLQLKFELQKERSIARLKKELERELRSEQAKVFVMGEVLKPGSVKYQVEDGMTLAEAINDAGSFKEESVDPKGIFVVRREGVNDSIPTVYQLPMESVQSIFFAEQFDVRPRDIVYVTATPSIRWNRVIAQLLPSLAILNTFRNFK
ncbi:MAG: polysaccharide export outer membrane protein [Cocleimonas sp.]|jgi:polysaccharide export outer membrane protein